MSIVSRIDSLEKEVRLLKEDVTNLQMRMDAIVELVEGKPDVVSDEDDSQDKETEYVAVESDEDDDSQDEGTGYVVVCQHPSEARAFLCDRDPSGSDYVWGWARDLKRAYIFPSLAAAKSLEEDAHGKVGYASVRRPRGYGPYKVIPKGE